MKIQHFLNGVEHERVQKAIEAAEQGNSGDIVIYISHRRIADPLAAANEAFRKLHLEAARAQNSLLIFIAPKSQTFAVVGGVSLHDKVGQAWWDELSLILTLHFKKGSYTDGLIAALEKTGQALREHFPAAAEDRSGQKDIVEE